MKVVFDTKTLPIYPQTRKQFTSLGAVFREIVLKVEKNLKGRFDIESYEVL